MKNWHYFVLGLFAVSVFTFVGCDDDEETISTVNFEEGIYNLTTSDLSPIEVELAIDPAASSDSEIEVDLTGADAGVAFTTDPAIAGTTVTIPVKAGDNSVSFTFTPIEAGIEGTLTVNLALGNVGDGLTTGLTTESIITVVDVGESLPLTENFEGCQEDPQQPIPDGWTEAVIEQNAEGSAVWTCVDENFFGFNAVAVNAFVPNSDDMSSSEVWLVTPRLNLTEASNPVLNFDVDRRFPGTGNFPDDLYDVLISTDYTVSVDDATWERFEPGFSAMTDNDPGEDGLTNTGDLDLSAFNGEVVTIAFVYRAGGPSSFDATILRIANVSVTDN
ncbi:MAG: hypothetical protein GVY26_04725 [Bacteroidetes bacterium]|jgi:hypothetical protein|nr:hypothetical protein [Bacteroidota bacterium]